MAATLVAVSVGGYFTLTRRSLPPLGVLPGEFETHEALVLAWHHRITPQQERELADIVAAAAGSVDVVILVENDSVARRARHLLQDSPVDWSRVRFRQEINDTPWVRDFGPLQIKTFSGEHLVVDTISDAPARRHEDLPTHLAKELGLPSISVPLLLDGGNLLSNGAGLCVTTEFAMRENARVLGLTRRQVEQALRRYLGANQLVVLKPLSGEPTSHVDMFATFAAPDVIVVGQYDRADDPLNATILDENAGLLSQVQTACGPLQVVRIPMPPRYGESWWSYTNVVYANGVLLLPRFRMAPEELEREAIATFQRVLPGWRIVPVSASSLMQQFGGLHCATAQLYRFGDGLPLGGTGPVGDARPVGAARPAGDAEPVGS